MLAMNIQLLPPEIIYKIFGYLTHDDLGRCLAVCKQWRLIGNDDSLWKRLCYKYRITKKTNEAFSHFESDTLCSWASIWFSFRKAPAYNWYSNHYRNVELSRNKYTTAAYTKNRFVVYSESFNNLDVYSDNRVRLLTSIALPFPSPVSDIGLAMNDKYIVVAESNIALVFFKSDNSDNYELNRAYSFLLDVAHAKRDFPQFIKQHLDPGIRIEIIGILDDFLWLDYVNAELTYAINVLTDETAIVHSYFSSFVHKNMFVTWSDDEIMIYNKEGFALVNIFPVVGVEEVSVNDTLIATLRGNIEGESIIQVWKLSTTETLMSKTISSYTWLKLHPTEEILFTLEASSQQSIYQITAWDIRSGDQKWVFKGNTFTNRFLNSIITCWKVHFVSERYLVTWPTTEKNTFYFIDSDTGECIYEQNKQLSEESVDYITDTMWISLSKIENKLLLNVRTYC